MNSNITHNSQQQETTQQQLSTIIEMASSCKRVKNPCKICLGNVTRKSGLKCEGACQSWVHYNCLNFTPGKISDIKHGLIIVNCPCPDCTTNLPKEMVRDEPFSCGNAYCPANVPPKCINAKCPSNATCPPPGHNSRLATPQRQHGPCTVDSCKTARVMPNHEFKCCSNKTRNISPSMSCCSGGDIKQAECITQTKPMYPPPPPPPPCPPPPCLPPPCQPPPCQPPPFQPPQYMLPPLPPPPPPPCPPPPCLPPPCMRLPCLQPPRPKPPRVKPPPPPPKCKYINTQATKKNTAAIKAMERMCSTMGQLTCQLNNLMDKMQQAMTMPQCPPSSNDPSIAQLQCSCGGRQPSGVKEPSISKSPNPSEVPCCLPEQHDCNYSYNSTPPSYYPSNPLRRNDFYSN